MRKLTLNNSHKCESLACLSRCHAGYRRFFVATACAAMLCGCDSSDDIANLNGIQESVEMESSSSDGTNEEWDMLSPEVYTSHIRNDRTELTDIIDNYEADCEELRNNEGKVISFENCVFSNMIAVDEVVPLSIDNKSNDCETSWNMIKNWLIEIGQYDDINMDVEVRDSGYGDGSIDYGNYAWPAAVDVWDDTDGAWFYINTETCYIQIIGSGIYAMSDGTMSGYVNDVEGTEYIAALDTFETTCGELVTEGTLDEIGNESYLLIDGEATIIDCSELVYDYFNYPNPMVKADIYNVRVYELADKYVYDFQVVRNYNGIPFGKDKYGNRSIYFDAENLSISGDIIDVYVATSDRVCAYNGSSDQTTIEAFCESYTSIVDIKTAAEILKDTIAENFSLDIYEAGLKYIDVSDLVSYKHLAPVAWEFCGINKNDGKDMKMYVDALTGEVYYYGYPSD